jgi:hypothetical protein
LDDFQDVFAEPSDFPPHRNYDHAITLLPRSVPVNARPYRYSPLHKDEIEKHVKGLLENGFITTSTKPICLTSVAGPKKGWNMVILCGL